MQDIKKQLVTLSDGRKARLLEEKGKLFQNISIVEVGGVLRVIDNQTKTLAKSSIISHINNKK